MPFDFLYNFCLKHFSSRYDHTSMLVFMKSDRYSYQILIKFSFSLQIFEKYSNMNFLKIRPLGACCSLRT